MPLKKSTATRRALELELELSGTPEQIWQAMATGPGYEAWFVPTSIEERVGGKLQFRFGPEMTQVGYVTRWQPPHCFGYEEVGWSGDAPPLATEIVIDAKAGGTCSVKMVHSLFTERDDWDQELEGFENGWPGFFSVLRIYLRSFAGAPGASGRASGGWAGSPHAAWDALTRELRLENVRQGERRDINVNGAPQLGGVVEELRSTEKDYVLTLRLDSPAPGVALLGAYDVVGTTQLVFSFYFYGAEAAAIEARETAKWRAWLAEHFPATSAKQRGLGVTSGLDG